MYYITISSSKTIAAYKRLVKKYEHDLTDLRASRLAKLTSIKCIRDDKWFSKWRPYTLDEATATWDAGDNTDVGPYGSFGPYGWDRDVEREELELGIRITTDKIVCLASINGDVTLDFDELMLLAGYW